MACIAERQIDHVAFIKGDEMLPYDIKTKLYRMWQWD